MPLAFVVDENLRGPVWNALQRARLSQGIPPDVFCVGEPSSPPLNITDPQLLIWTEKHQRILISNDRNTLQDHLEDHLAAGRTSPGIFIVRPTATIPAVRDFICLAAELDEPEEWKGRVQYIP
jgi:hypothetical protein